MIFEVIQILLAIILIFLILVQTRGTGFARSTSSPSSFTRRGLEKLVFKLTFIISAGFVVISIFKLIV